MKAGDIVRFSNPDYERGENVLLFVLMDEPDKVLNHIEQFKAKHPTWKAPLPNVDIKLLRDRKGEIQKGPFVPIQTVLLSDIEPVL